MSHSHGTLPRMPYEPDPTRWPARCAAYLTQARALLVEPTALLVTDVWVNELVAAEGLGADVQQALSASDPVQVAELEAPGDEIELVADLGRPDQGLPFPQEVATLLELERATIRDSLEGVEHPNFTTQHLGHE